MLQTRNASDAIRPASGAVLAVKLSKPEREPCFLIFVNVGTNDGTHTLALIITWTCGNTIKDSCLVLPSMRA